MNSEKNTILMIFPSLFSTKTMNYSVLMDHPPLGILTIAAPVLEKGYKVIILDEQVEDNFDDKLNLLLTENILCVGISSMCGSHIKSALRICKYIKSFKNVPIVAGGVHVTLSPEKSLDNPYIDIIVIGDGEETFCNIIDALKYDRSLSAIQGIGYKSDGQIHFTKPSEPADITRIPRLPFELMQIEKYHPGPLHFWPSNNRIFAIETSRGCPYSCIFCTESVRKKKWRALNEEQVIEDIKYYNQRYQVENFLFIDDNFFGDKKRSLLLIDLLINSNLKINWYTNVRADFLIKMGTSFLQKLEKSGCKMLTFGAESGSQRILDMIEKKSNVNDIYEINRRLKKTKIVPHFVAIRGFPSETKKDLLMTFTLAMNVLLTNKKSCFDIPHLIPTPGTKIAEECLGDKINHYTLDEWQQIFELEEMKEKPEWLLDETYDFMKKNLPLIYFISKVNRPYYPMAQRIYFRILLRIILFLFKTRLFEVINLNNFFPLK